MKYKKLENKFQSKYPLSREAYNLSKLHTENKDLTENVQDKQREANSQTKIPDIEINQEEECRGYFIKNDQKLSDANQYLNNALAFIEIIKHSADRLKTCNERIRNR